jgi:type VI secretion system protein ImpI
MARGVRLVILDRRTGDRAEHEFPRFPVRIGRNRLNDLQISDNVVSQFHAVLEMHGGRIAVRDLGSKNGTAVAGLGRLPPNALTELDEHQNEFYLAHFFLRAVLLDLAPESLSHVATTRLRHAEESGGFSAHTVLNQLEDDDDEDDAPTNRTLPHGNVLGQPFVPLYKAYRESWSALSGALKETLGGLDEQLRRQAYAELARAFPGLTNEPEFRELQDPAAGEEPAVSSRGARAPANLSTIALSGLQRLASVYLPPTHTLNTPQDVALFLEKVFEVVDVFLRCFIPMREGYRSFTTQLDVPTTRGEPPSPEEGAAVDAAVTPNELGAALLDWKRPPAAGQPRPSQTVEWVFADVMIHHMAMITGVMQGVKSLLGELAPSAIERRLDDPKRSPGGLQIGPFRYKQLWELYATRHSDLADEDKETFAFIFGADFARAYSQLTSDTQAVAAIRFSSQFPTRTPSAATAPPPPKTSR